MRGTIIQYDAKNTRGIIKDDQGNSWPFDSSRLQSSQVYVQGMICGFDRAQDGIENIVPFAYRKLEKSTKDAIEKLLEYKTGQGKYPLETFCYDLAARNIDYKNYYRLAETLVCLEFPNRYTVISENFYKEDRYVRVDYIVPLSWRKKLPDLATLKKKLKQVIEQEGYYSMSMLPDLLDELHIPLKEYARNQIRFADVYLGDEFEHRELVNINGRINPSVLFYKDAPQTGMETEHLMAKSLAEKWKEIHADTPFLFSGFFAHYAPGELSIADFQFCLDELYDYAGFGTDSTMSEFEQEMISCCDAGKLLAKKEQERFMHFGLQNCVDACSPAGFKKIYRAALAGGKNTNNTWASLAQRFCALRSRFSLAFTIFWMLESEKIKQVDYYLDTFASIDNLSHLDLILTMWEKIAPEAFPIRLKRKCLGHVIDTENIDQLKKTAQIMDDGTMPEIELIEKMLEAPDLATAKDAARLFECESGPLVAEKTIGLLWKKLEPGFEAPRIVIEVLKYVCKNYSSAFAGTIVFNKFLENESTQTKAGRFCVLFEDLATRALADDSLFELCGYIYNELMLKFDMPPKEKEKELYEKLCQRKEEKLKSSWKADAKSAMEVLRFRYDPGRCKDLMSAWLLDVLYPWIDGSENQTGQMETQVQEKQEEKEARLFEAISWKIDFVNTALRFHYYLDESAGYDACLLKGEFETGLQLLQNQNLSQTEYEAALCRLLEENFRQYGYSKKAAEVYDLLDTIQDAEKALLSKINVNQDNAIGALFALYLHTGEYLKLSYLYGPYASARSSHQPAFYELTKLKAAKKGVSLHENKSHLSILRIAITALPAKEFDDFLQWCSSAAIPVNSKNYVVENQLFNRELRLLLANPKSKDSWNLLLKTAMRTDSSIRMDNHHYAVLLHYLIRFGKDAFLAQMEILSKESDRHKSVREYMARLSEGMCTSLTSSAIFSFAKDLVDTAPLQFWNYFYNDLVLSNHIFAGENLWGEIWYNGIQDVPVLYFELIEKWQREKEEVFGKTALAILQECEKKIENPFCLLHIENPENFDSIIRFLLQAAAKTGYTDEIKAYLQNCLPSVSGSRKTCMTAFLAVLEKDIESLKTLLEISSESAAIICKHYFDLLAGYPDFDSALLKAYTADPALSFELQRALCQLNPKAFLQEARPEIKEGLTIAQHREQILLYSLCLQKNRQMSKAQKAALDASLALIDGTLSQETLSVNTLNESDEVSLAAWKIAERAQNPSAALHFFAGILGGCWSGFIERLDDFDDSQLEYAEKLLEEKSACTLHFVVCKCILGAKSIDEKKSRTVENLSTMLPQMQNVLDQLNALDQQERKEACRILYYAAALDQPRPDVKACAKNMAQCARKEQIFVHTRADLLGSVLRSLYPKKELAKTLCLQIDSEKPALSSMQFERMERLFSAMEMDSYYTLLQMRRAIQNGDKALAASLYDQMQECEDILPEWKQSIASFLKIEVQQKRHAVSAAILQPAYEYCSYTAFELPLMQEEESVYYL
jgi:hypothetical protein